MGKTKTAFVAGSEETKVTGAEKYKERQKKKAVLVEAAPSKEKKEKVHIAGLKGGQRIKVVEAEIPSEVSEETIPESAKSEPATEKRGKPKVRGKKYQNAKAKIDRNKLYPTLDAIKLIKETSYSSFDGTVELHLLVKRIGLTSNVKLPHPFGKTKKIEVASDETIEKLKAGKIDFDVLLATPEMMPKLVPYARLLGPKGLMPNPKNKTLITNPSVKSEALKSAESMFLKTEKDSPVVHTVAGKVSFDNKDLQENVEAILSAIGVKQIEKVYIKSSMSPSVKVSF
jgi:large subunit ribosomal protein L1